MVRLSPAVSWFLLGFGVWSWAIWPVFLRNIAADPRAFDHGSPTAFFLVHLVLTVVSLALGTVIGVLGIRGLLAARRLSRAAGAPVVAEETSGDSAPDHETSDQEPVSRHG
jgi:hypothetical protein